MKIRIKSISNLGLKNVNIDKVYLRIAIAVGRHILDVKDSPKVSPTNPRWVSDDVSIFN